MDLDEKVRELLDVGVRHRADLAARSAFSADTVCEPKSDSSSASTQAAYPFLKASTPISAASSATAVATPRSPSASAIAFSNDFSSPQALAAGIAEETSAITAIGESLAGSGKPFVVCSGTPWVPGRASTEDDPLPLDGAVGARAVTVNRVLALKDQGVRSSAVRLPRTVHQNGEGGFAGALTEVARSTGVSGYPGDGAQRWPAAHSADAASLFRLALENAPAGSSWHAVADEADPVRAIADIIGRRLGVPVQSVPDETYGALGSVFALDQPSSSIRTRQELGWVPTHPSLLEDLELTRP